MHSLRAFHLKLACYGVILALLGAPFYGHAESNFCESWMAAPSFSTDVRDPLIQTLIRGLKRDQFKVGLALKYRAQDAQAVDKAESGLRQLIATVHAHLTALGIEHQVNAEQTRIEISPGTNSYLNILAKNLSGKWASKIVVDPRAIGTSTAVWDYAKRELVCDYATLVTGVPTSAFVHEFRHLMTDVTTAKDPDSNLLADYVIPMSGRILPGMEARISSYGNGYRLDEISNHNHDLILKIREVLLHGPGAVDESVYTLQEQARSTVKLIADMQSSALRVFELAGGAARARGWMQGIADRCTSARTTPDSQNSGRAFTYSLPVRIGEGIYVYPRVNLDSEKIGESASVAKVLAAAAQRFDRQVVFLNELGLLVRAAELRVEVLDPNDRESVLAFLATLRAIEVRTNRAMSLGN